MIHVPELDIKDSTDQDAQVQDAVIQEPTKISLEDLLKLNRAFMTNQLAMKNFEIASLRFPLKMDELNKQIEDLKKQMSDIEERTKTSLAEQNEFMLELSVKYGFSNNIEINLITGEILNAKSE